MADTARRERSRLAIALGMDSPLFAPAVHRFEKLLSDMEQTLAHGPWLAGDEYSLADIAYSPYMVRLQHLDFGERITTRPRVADWTRRLFATTGYKLGVAQWFNSGYLELFERERPGAQARVQQLLSA